MCAPDAAAKAAPSRSSMLRLTSCFVIMTTFTTVLLFLLLRKSNEQAVSLSEAVSALSLSSQQTQVLLQQQTQQLEHIKQQNQQQQEENDLSSKNKNNIKSKMTRKEKYDEEHSCLSSNVTFSDLFCERKVRVSHKMGYALGLMLFKNTKGHVWTEQKRVSDKPMMPGKMDYRDVLIVRDMYEAIVSGYLYHKSGRECHLTSNGTPWNRKPSQNVGINKYWDVNLVKTQEKVKQFVRNNNNTSKSNKINVHRKRPNQTMCEYLQETAESGGKQGVELAMLTYMHNVFKLWYLPLLRNLDRVIGTIGNDNHRTLLVCFEELEDPKQQPHVVQTILHFWFPADARGQQPRQRHLAATEPPAPPPQAYSGGHATDRDPQVRAALKEIIRKLDVDYFDGVIAKYQAIIGCTSR